VHVIFDAAGTFDPIATVLASRSEPGLMVCVNQDGLSRPLNDAEHREVHERVREVRFLRAMPCPARA
jgi:hypothetical protein